MRVVVAPGDVPGASSVDAARQLAAGWARVRPDDALSAVPLPDPRTPALEALAAAVPASRRRTVVVADARGHAAEPPWLRLPDGALVDAAVVAAGGTGADPGLATSYGVGQIVAAAAADGASRVVVALAGPPDHPPVALDGGSGLGLALGHRLLRGDGNGLKVGGAHLRDLDRVVPSAMTLPPVVGAVGGTWPLLGPDGALASAARVCGADPRRLRGLEEGLRVLAAVVRRDLGRDPAGVPGAGACGGLGFGLAAFAGASLVDRLEVLADLAGLDGAIGEADAVVTAGAAAAWVTQRAAVTGVAMLDATPAPDEHEPALGQRASALAAALVPGRRTPKR